MSRCAHPEDEPHLGVFVFDVGYCITRPPSPRNILFRQVVVSGCSEVEARLTAIYMVYAMGQACTREEQLAKGLRVPRAHHRPIAHMPGIVEMVTSCALLTYYE